MTETLTHDQVIRELRALGKKIDLEVVASAFVASLGQKPGFWLEPLMALAIARAVPTHRVRPRSTGECRDCGLRDPVVLEPLRSDGACLPDDLATALLVLRAAKTAEAPVASKADIARIAGVLGLVSSLPPTASEGKLNAAIASKKLVVGNKYVRRHVIETLGACGIFETPEHPGFTTRWTTHDARQARPSTNVEPDPPIAFWRAADGANAANVRTWLGHLGVKAPAAPAGASKVREKAEAARARREKAAARTTQLAVGDAVAFDLGGSWAACTVVAHARYPSGTVPVIEMLDWRGDRAPDAATLRGVRARGEVFAGVRCRNALVMVGMLRANGPGWVRVASGVPRPSSEHLAPRNGRGFIRVRDLIQSLAASEP